jgi:hypothetical protein
MTTAQKQADRLDKQLQDKNLDPQERLKLENDYDDLYSDILKYKGYGGFKKGSGGKSNASAIANAIGKRNATNLSTYNDLASLLKGTRGRTQKYGRKVTLRKKA